MWPKQMREMPFENDIVSPTVSPRRIHKFVERYIGELFERKYTCLCRDSLSSNLNVQCKTKVRVQHDHMSH